MALLKDLYLNHTTGDIELSPTGDIKCVYDDDVIVGGIQFRLKTAMGDYLYEPECGASLTEFVGEPNTSETASIIKARVVDALTHDEFLLSTQFSVDVIPTSETTVAVVVRVEGIRGIQAVAASLDLTTANLELASS